MADTIDYIIYARKSTDVEDKQVRSIDAQLSELNELASRCALKVVDIIIEKESAKTPLKRPKFNAMIERIDRGEIKGIITWHPDRLARNMSDGGRLIDLIDTGKLLSLRFPAFWFEPTPQGKFMLGMAFSQSKYYSDALADNTRRGLREKVRRGEYPQLAPLGYLNDRRLKRIAVDQERAPIIRSLFELFATGKVSVSDLQHYLSEQGVHSRTGKLVSNTAVTCILKNPLYYGHFRYAGEVYEGVHTPLISKSLFDRVQQIFEFRWRYSPKASAAPTKPFLGLFRCGECGSAITGEFQKGHTYYRCTKKNKAARCSQSYLREEVLDGQIKQLLHSYILPDGWADGMLTRLNEEKHQAALDKSALVGSKHRVVALIKTKVENLVDMRVDGLIDATTYTTKKLKLMGQIKAIDEELTSINQGQITWLEPLQNWIIDAKNLAKIIETGSLIDRKILAKKIFGSNLVLEGKKARGEAINPWSQIGKTSLGDTQVHLYEIARTAYQGRTNSSGHSEGESVRKAA